MTIDLPERITPRALAKYLDVTWRTVSRWSREGRLPEPRRVGNSMFWLPSDLESILGAREQPGQGGEQRVS